MRLSGEPIVTIGVVEGLDEYQFFDISGAARLADGSVVVAESGARRVQRFGPGGEHLWSRGRQGEGPGEFQYVELLGPCTDEQSVVVYDIYNHRVTVFDGGGNLIREYPFLFQQRVPRDISCAPGGRLVVTGWGNTRHAEPGTFRTETALAFGDAEGVTILREGVPAEDRVATTNTSGMVTGSRPGIWSRKLMFAPTDLGVWLGSGDDHEIEFLDWTGTTTRRIRWEGPELAVAEEHLQAYQDSLRDYYSSGSDPDWRPRFEARWEREREILPSSFPAYDRVLLSDDGVLWVQGFVRKRDALDVERLEVHALVEN